MATVSPILSSDAAGTSAYLAVRDALLAAPRTWLVTGAAGFIGSHLVETLLALDQTVIGLDNFATGHRHNLALAPAGLGAAQGARWRFIEGDIRDQATCHAACQGVDYVLHQAALGSVPRSLQDPVTTNGANIDGFLHMLVAARDAGVKRFVYAASSSTYGDHPGLPKVEDRIGKPLSPYAVTKYVNELYADVFGRSYGTESIGLRYFNVFGPRQDPNGAYAAVIPKWAATMLRGESVRINGDGETSRDFCYIANTVQANLLAATTTNPDAVNQVYNVAVGDQTTLNTLYTELARALRTQQPSLVVAPAVYGDFRAGDVRHSRADIGKAASLLGYSPTHRFGEGLTEAALWYATQSAA